MYPVVLRFGGRGLMSSAGPFCANRLFEWFACLVMLGEAFMLATNPAPIEISSFRFLVQIGFDRLSLLLLFALVGSARAIALCLNGRQPRYGPLVRAASALVGAIVWCQMGIALQLYSMVAGVPTPGVPIYLFLAVGELVSCYRAARDGAGN